MPVLIGGYNLVDRPFFLTLHLYCDFFKTFFSLNVWGGGDVFCMIAAEIEVTACYCKWHARKSFFRNCNSYMQLTESAHYVLL